MTQPDIIDFTRLVGARGGDEAPHPVGAADTVVHTALASSALGLAGSGVDAPVLMVGLAALTALGFVAPHVRLRLRRMDSGLENVS